MTLRTDFIILPAAERDIEDILRYTLERWGEEQVVAYWSTIWDAAQLLRRFPEMGRPGLRPDEREYLLPHHIIVYRFDESRNLIVILRIVSHGRRR